MKQSQLLPNASIDEYFQYWLKDIPERCDKGIVGYIRNTTNEQLVISIEIDDDFMKDRNHSNICFCVDYNNYQSECTIVLTSSYFQDIYKNNFLLSAIWHEVGHFHTIHYFDTDFVNHFTKNKRQSYYEQGKVMEEEQAADLFSLYYTSKEQWLKSIRYFIRKRYNLEWDENRFIAVNEMRDRRKIIESIESEDQLKKMLCDLCKVSVFDKIVSPQFISEF